jgi:hypothetical protein
MARMKGSISKGPHRGAIGVSKSSKNRAVGGLPKVRNPRNVSNETVSFVKHCILPLYKRSKGWGFLKLGKGLNTNTIVNALFDRHIVSSTGKSTIRAALKELEQQEIIKLPPPVVGHPKRK